MWSFFSRSSKDKNATGNQSKYGAIDENATPKISHHKEAPPPQDEPLLPTTAGSAKASNQPSFQRSHSLEARLDDGSHEVQHQKIIIEGAPGEWFRHGNQMTDDHSHSSFYTGVHTLESVSSLLTETAHKIVDKSFRLSGIVSSVRDFGGTASIPSEVFNLIKNLIGAVSITLKRVT